MNLKEYFHRIDAGELERYIQEGQEEHITLEFKTVNHPDYNSQNREYDKKNLSEALSGFANSGGGIIIWGIKAQKNKSGQDIAFEKRPIRELTKFLNLLNRLEGQAVVPLIGGIEHVKIEETTDIGYIKTLVPPSDAAPHMAQYAEKHYYKRSGDSFYRCEHYDIADMFSRRKAPVLELTTRTQPKRRRLRSEWEYGVVVSIHNKGTRIAKFPYLALNLSPGYSMHEFGMDGNRNTGLERVRNNMLYQFNYSGGNDRVIYPGAILDVDIITTSVLEDSRPPDLTITYLLTAEDMESLRAEQIISGEVLWTES